MNGAMLAGRIDYAFLKVSSGTHVAQLKQAVAETKEYGFRSLCVPPVLAGTVKRNHPELTVGAVVAYPLGLETLAAKVFAIQELIELGVDEVDVVYDLFALVNGNLAKLEQEATRLGEMTSKAGVLQKAIIETPILDDEQLRAVCEMLRDSPVDCIKTSTGYGREPTSPDHVRLIRQVVGTRKLVKAAGGISNLYQMRAMLDAGADIIGTSHAVKITQETAAEITEPDEPR
jgi:deoxyribose-phosphate aldolase